MYVYTYVCIYLYMYVCAAAEDEINFKERAQNFEEAFNKIKASTGISDIDELVRTFIKNEEHNFSLFNYVTEQNNEIEKFEEQIQALKDEEQRFEKESGNDANQVRSLSHTCMYVCMYVCMC